jgi:hypothetical protein
MEGVVLLAQENCFENNLVDANFIGHHIMPRGVQFPRRQFP